ncbi:MAG: DUF5752 family protein [Chloroflexota bacterium]
MEAFHFFTKLDQTLLLGLRASSIEELLVGMRSVPDSSIYFHTHRFLVQHHFLSPEPPNDFAYWVTHVLGNDSLGERLWSVDTVQFNAIGDLRAKMIAILESHLAMSGRKTESQAGEEFYFMASRIFVLPTGYRARDLDEFARQLTKVSINSVYFHMFDAKLRLKSGENDFSRWFRHIGHVPLADETRRLDPYAYTLDGLRQHIIALVKQHDRH